MAAHVDIVFDGPPGPEGGRFVEVENASGASITFADWVQRADGYWVLRLTPHPNDLPHIHVAGTTVGKHIDECALCGRDLRCDIHLRATSKSDAAREMEKAMGPRANPPHPMFRDHNCARCSDGKKPCLQGGPHRCEYPHARND